MPIIRSYGVHWHIDRVFWGRQNVRGNLLGAASRNARARPVDFREQRGIYVLYADYEIVYIGQAGAGIHRLFNRLNAHRTDHLSERWNRFSWFGTQWVTKTGELSKDTQAVQDSTEIALNILEAVSIAIAEPRLNLQRGRWGKAQQYFQWVEGLGECEEEEEEEEEEEPTD
jgi:hypothetical protein